MRQRNKCLNTQDKTTEYVGQEQKKEREGDWLPATLLLNVV